MKKLNPEPDNMDAIDATLPTMSSLMRKQFRELEFSDINVLLGFLDNYSEEEQEILCERILTNPRYPSWLNKMKEVEAEKKKQKAALENASELSLCILRFQQLELKQLPQEVQQSITKLIGAINKLDQYINEHPNHKLSIYQFEYYYIPEVYELIKSYLKDCYLFSKQGNSNDLCGELKKSIDSLEASIHQKMSDLNKEESVGLLARMDVYNAVLNQGNPK